MLRVLIIQRIVPEVRQAFFKKVLGRGDGFNIKLLSSDQADSEGHKLVSLGQNHSVVGIRYFKGLIHFQNSLGAVLRSDILVVEHALNSLSNLINIFFCLLLRKPLILWGHGGSSHVLESPVTRTCKAFLLRVSNAYIGYTDQSRRTLIAAGYDARKIHIINNSAIYDSKKHPHINDSGFKDSRVKFVFCGRLTKQKRLNDLIKAFRILTQGNPEVEMHMIGGGAEEATLKDLAADLSNIYFHGPMFDIERDELMSSCHAQIIPNHVGLGILQGFALGLPLITSRDGNHCPEIEYYAERQNGLSYDLGSDKSLSDAMAQLVSFERWRTLSEGATQTASMYPVSAMASLFLNAMSELSNAETTTKKRKEVGR